MNALSRRAMRIACVALFLPHCVAGVEPVQTEVYRSGEGGYHTYRIPALITTPKGTLLAFCEGRKNGGGDAGNIDVLLRRSFDGGKTWGSVQKIADMEDNTIGNPAPVIERKSGTIFLLLTRNPGRIAEKTMPEGLGLESRTVWIMRSRDDGATWSNPANITASVKRPEWTWYATGPGNGIQLQSGRLVIPCDHDLARTRQRYSHVIYSDDRGETWKIGGVAEINTNESAIVELKDGSLLFNMRSYHGKNRRAVQRSTDGGITFGPLSFDEALIEPVCQASLISTKKGLLFSNPAAKTRTRMTVKLSIDGGKTWPNERVIHEGPAAYSNLTVLKDGSVGLLYERGDANPYERITFARFPLAWVAGNK